MRPRCPSARLLAILISTNQSSVVRSSPTRYRMHTAGPGFALGQKISNALHRDSHFSHGVDFLVL